VHAIPKMPKLLPEPAPRVAKPLLGVTGMPLPTNVAEAGSWASAPGDDLNARTAAAAMSRTQASATRRHDRLNDLMSPSGEVLQSAAPQTGASVPPAPSEQDGGRTVGGRQPITGRPTPRRSHLRRLHSVEPAHGRDRREAGRVLEPHVGDPAARRLEHDRASGLAAPRAGPVVRAGLSPSEAGALAGFGVGCPPGVLEAAAPVTTHVYEHTFVHGGAARGAGGSRTCWCPPRDPERAGDARRYPACPTPAPRGRLSGGPSRTHRDRVGPDVRYQTRNGPRPGCRGPSLRDGGGGSTRTAFGLSGRSRLNDGLVWSAARGWAGERSDARVRDSPRWGRADSTGSLPWRIGGGL